MDKRNITVALFTKQVERILSLFLEQSKAHENFILEELYFTI